MRIEVTTAIIAAAASLAGGLVGGGITYLANEQERDERDDRERAGARAVAMLQANHFRTVRAELRVMETEKIYLSREDEPELSLSSEDLALVVARLTHEQSADLADARVCLSHLETLLAGHQAGEKVKPLVAIQMAQFRECARVGQAALEPVVSTEPIE